jgi:putative two-component system hydrogenase maturation factor HypX/HoxX
MALPEAAGLPEWPQPLWTSDGAVPQDWDELHYEEFGPPGARVGWLAFEMHNGALGERASARLLAAWREACTRNTQVLVLAGGADSFCNGIHLHEIEAAGRSAGDSAAEASMRSIEAIDDLALALITTTDRLVISTLRGNAGAGGCFLALAADAVWSLPGVVLNPHYRNMGNLHGSEYWTYLLPRRIGTAGAAELMRGRLPMGAAEALRRGLVDAVLKDDTALRAQALALAASADLAQRIAAKAARRAADEARRPLADHRADELAAMRRNFFGFDPSYHVARHHFVHRKPHAWTPRHLATHRR